MNHEIVFKIAKIVGNVLFAILGIILVFCLYSFISMKVLSHKYVNFFSYTVFQIGSNSMAPSITTNDLIIVKLTDQIKKGGQLRAVLRLSTSAHQSTSRTPPAGCRSCATPAPQSVVCTAQSAPWCFLRFPYFSPWFRQRCLTIIDLFTHPLESPPGDSICRARDNIHE